MSEIILDRVEHDFGTAWTVSNVSLCLTEHRIGIVGSNGSGKSTLARMLNGLIIPRHGRVLVNGFDTARQGREVRRRVGFIFTDPDSQIVMPTVEEDIAFSLRRLRLDPAESAARVNTALHRFGLTDLAEHSTHHLSGGQKQLLALAAVLVMNPEVVVADEPTTLLDARNTKRVTSYLNKLDQQLIVVTHQLDLLDTFDRVIVMEEGHVIADDVPAAALPHYRALIA